MLLNGMGESFLLTEDEPLTLNIGGVVALWFLEIGPKTRKPAKNWQKLALSILVFCPVPLEEIQSNLLIPELRNRPRWDKKIIGTRSAINYRRIGHILR